MNVLRELTDVQRRQIASYNEKWKRIGLSTEPVDRERATEALGALYREIGLKPPDEQIFFISPASAWADFSSWFPRIGRCLVSFWPYQLPLFDPRSFWRKFGDKSDTVDLTVRRVGRPGEAWTRQSPGNEVNGTALNAAVSREIWKAFDGIFDVDWAWRAVRDIGADFPDEHYRMDDQSDQEDPSNPIDVAEYIYLGPFQWLIQELACVDFSREELGVQVNESLYQSLTELVLYGSILLTFERLWIICERPAALFEGSVVARYRDGFTVS